MSSLTSFDPDVVRKARKTAERISETIYMIGNEPTLACYRIQEHVHKSGPVLIDKGSEMKRLNRNLQGCAYGVDYSIKAIKSMKEGLVHLQNIHELLKNTLFIKQQLNYEESIKVRVRAKQAAVGSSGISASTATGSTNLPSNSPAGARRSPFQRFSGSFDIPATLISSSLSGISSSASADLKELKATLSGLTKADSTSPASSVQCSEPTEATTCAHETASLPTAQQTKRNDE